MAHPLVTIDEMTEMEDLLKRGIPRTLALQKVGINRDRYGKIHGASRAGDAVCTAWLEGLDQAEAHAKVEHLSKLAESPDWRAREKVLQQIDPSLYDGSAAEFNAIYNWMVKVISEEVDDKTFERILNRFATEDHRSQMEGAPAEGAEAELH